MLFPSKRISHLRRRPEPPHDLPRRLHRLDPGDALAGLEVIPVGEGAVAERFSFQTDCSA